MLAFSVTSCDRNNDNLNDNGQIIDNDTYATAYNVSPTFTRVNDNLYRYADQFNTPLIESDVVLIYMQNGTTTTNAPIYKLLPYTFFVGNAANDQIDYGFDFSRVDISITVNSTSTLSLTANPTYYTGKNFRVVVLPAKTGKNASVNFEKYEDVASFYNIKESNVKNLK